MKKISIIVPVYNTEKYLSKCFESIENQQVENLEVVVVNDGSSDNSEKIIENYQNKSLNIKYIKKKNGGLSDARNCGIKAATGDYICFIDSDDYISNELLSNLQKYMCKDYDLIKYKMVKVDEMGNEIEMIDGPIFENKTGEEAFNELYGKDKMLDPAWLYVYKKSFWDENNFEYPVGKMHEDFALTALIMLKAKKVASCNIYGYYYVQSSNSITRGNEQEKILKRLMDLLAHYDNMIETINDYNLQKKTIENLKIYYTNCILLKLDELSNENKKIYLKEIKKRKIFKNIKIRNFKQFIKRVLINVNVSWYLKLR